jgi:hypothetical protein
MVIGLATGIAWACGGSSDNEKSEGDDSEAGQSGEGGANGGSAGRGGTGTSGDAGTGDTGGQPDRGGSGGTRGGTTSGGTAGTLGGEGGQPGGAAGGGGDDPCDPNPCLNGGVCSDDAGSYACMCIDGYLGDRCQTLGVMEACTTACSTPGMRGCETAGQNCGPCLGTEVCNNCDDDGVNGADDTFACAQGRSARCTTLCGSTGSRTCALDCSGYGACIGTEVCNACDDDGMNGPDNTFACVRGTSEACTTTCGTSGMHTCANDCSGFGFCRAAAETCGNNCDDDGVGGPDNGCTANNDNRANATIIPLGTMETTVTGSTVGATLDGPAVNCGCTDAGNVWYRFTTLSTGVVYFDTAGSAYDTSLFITDSLGNALPAQPQNDANGTGLCNDDGYCASGSNGWNSSLNSRTWGYLTAGTYYLAVGGCSTGAFTLHAQFVPTTVGRFFYPDRLAGDATTSTFLLSTSMTEGLCGGSASGEDVRWMISCGDDQEFFSLCQSDLGTFSRNINGTLYDPTMYVRSALTGTELVCNDDGGAANCAGTGGDNAQFGSRISGLAATRGITTVFVDTLSGASGMTYTLKYTAPSL